MFAFAASALSAAAPVDPQFAQAVIEGLTREGQKTLPPSWFYDEVGSALFETITLLPEYGLTRAEGQLLALDEKTGKPLWHFRVNGPVNSSPMVYMAGGKEFIAITASTQLLTFGLPD